LLKLILLLCIIELFVLTANAQQKYRSISIEIKSETGVDLINSTIKIVEHKKSFPHFYGNSEGNNPYLLKVNFTATDTIILSFSHVGHTTKEIKYSPESFNSATSLSVILPISRDTLKTVEVTPNIIKRGDTTIFRIEKFKEGDEKKLKDLILKLPGFKIDETGTLTYKRKKVEGITVNGQDLFSEKTELLLQNFPVHVLQTIEALENQTDQKLLKGLVNGGKVVVNLVVKDDKMQRPFGDATVALGTDGRYWVNPVLFSILKSVSLGYIGKIGNAAGDAEEKALIEKQLPEIQSFEEWLISDQLINNIYDVEKWNYIPNNEIANNIKISVKHADKSKSGIELNQFSDKQTQSIDNNAIFVNGNDLLRRNENTFTIYKPSRFNAKIINDWDYSSKSSLKTTFLFNSKNNSLTQLNKYEQENAIDSASNELENSHLAFLAKLELTKRLSEKTGLSIFVKCFTGEFNQLLQAKSNSWPIIFQIPDETYKYLQLNTTNKSTQFDSEIRYYRNTKKGVVSNSLNFFYERISIDSRMLLDSTIKTNTPITINPFNNFGKYDTYAIKGKTQKVFRIFKLPFRADVEYGITTNLIKENNTTAHFTNALLNLSINQKRKFGKKIDGSLDLSYKKNPVPPINFFQIPLPNSFSGFSQHMIPKGSINGINATYGFSYNFKSVMPTLYMSINYSQNFNGYVNSNNFNEFIQIARDSFVRKSTSNFGIYMNYSIPFLFLRTLIEIDASFQNHNLLYNIDKEIKKGKIRNYYATLRLKKNWNKRFYLVFTGSYSQNQNVLPNSLLTNDVNTMIHNLKLNLQPKWLISQKINILINGSYYLNNLFSQNLSTFPFLEAVCNFSFPKVPFGFTVRGQNLTQTKSYVLNNISAFNQNITTIPLLKRNLQLAVRYEF
jgi:hypothetical protein